MKVVLDTNVLISGVFFSGPPRPILEAWRDGRVELVVSDPTDDKFFACALGAVCRVIVSGDRQVLAASGYEGVEVLRPRSFVERHL